MGQRKIIGITGPSGAGKTEVAKILVNQGYYYVSFRKYIEKELINRKIDITKKNINKIAKEIRKEHGLTYFIKKILNDTKDIKKIVIESIREPETARLLQSKGAYLLQVTADQNIRYQRIKQRNNVINWKTLRDFQNFEKAEMKGNDFELNLKDTLKLSDDVIQNNGSYEDLKIIVDDLKL